MTLSRPPTMILTFSPLPSPLLPEPVEAVLAASLAQAVSEERASRPEAARAAYLAVLRMAVHVLVRVRCGEEKGPLRRGGGEKRFSCRSPTASSGRCGSRRR